jgi:predicted AAA+ superfamily ATPase
MKRSSGSLAPEERGASFKGMVAQLIRAYKDYRAICDDSYYRAPSGRFETEVDFLLPRGSDLIAVEAKSGSTFTATWCKGLRAITNRKGLIRRVIVYPRGPLLKTKNGIDVFPFQHFSDLPAASNP